MSKPNFYGAYGKSRAGIYTSYQRLMNARRFIDGLNSPASMRPMVCLVTPHAFVNTSKWE